MELRPRTITSEVQLLVEGRDAAGVLSALLKHLSLRDVQIQNFGGVSELRTFLRAFVKASDFSRVRSLGIVRDAEKDAAGAFASVQGSLRHASLPVPHAVEERAGNHPEVSVMILPGGNRSGMLETLLCETFGGDDVCTCIDAFFDCVKGIRGRAGDRLDKARARVFLATRPHPHLSLGDAAQRGYWDLDHTTLKPLHEFLRVVTAVPLTTNGQGV